VPAPVEHTTVEADDRRLTNASSWTCRTKSRGA
jgi:hypothetical protein